MQKKTYKVSLKELFSGRVGGVQELICRWGRHLYKSGVSAVVVH